MEKFKGRTLKDLKNCKWFTIKDRVDPDPRVWYNLLEREGRTLLYSNAILYMGTVNEDESTNSYVTIERIERGLVFEFTLYFSKCTCFFSPQSTLEEINYNLKIAK